MVRITEELVRKRAEHNEGEIFSLEELSLHQQNIEKIEYLDKWCRELKILYLQNNLISRIEGVSRLKKLEYLNLALNNIEKIENLEGCESLQKLDLTVNFIGDLISIESLDRLYSLEEMYLTGNPCTEYPNYREFVVATLPQLQKLDGVDISKSERILALQKLRQLRNIIGSKQAEHINKRNKERIDASIRRRKHREKLDSCNGDIEPMVEEFWQEKVPYTPESRMETHEFMEMREKSREMKSDKSEVIPKRPPLRLFAEDGRPYNINEARIDFSLKEDIVDDEEVFILDVSVYKNMDTTAVSCDVQTTYVRITIRGKILQLALPHEIQTDRSHAQRSQTTGHLVVKMPKVTQNLQLRQARPNSKKTPKDASKIKDDCSEPSLQVQKGTSQALLELERNTHSKQEDWRNIVQDKAGVPKMDNNSKIGFVKSHKPIERPNSPGFVDSSEVPPLI